MTDEKRYFWDKNATQGGGSNIWVPDTLKGELRELKIHPRESFYSVIDRLLHR